jgi:hypothetical protein
MKTVNRCILVACLCMLCIQENGSGAGQSISISVRGPRPVAKAADELELKYGMLITYEDAQSFYAGDYVDKASPQNKARGAKALLPIDGHIEVSFAVSAQTKLPVDPRALIGAVVDDHADRGMLGDSGCKNGWGVTRYCRRKQGMLPVGGYQWSRF